MQTKLGVICHGIIEAGWLTTVIAIPLFFNFYSCRIFEPAKITLLRSIALVMILAWVIRLSEVGFQGSAPREVPSLSSLWHVTSRNPLVLPSLLLAGVYILTTISSVIPGLSLWGSYTRRQGTYTVLSYMVIFFLTWHFLRTRQQLKRLIMALLLTSLPVSLYGIMQHYGLDPLPWSGRFEGRVIATMGNPIYLGAYLIMVVPLTLERFLRSFSVLRYRRRPPSHYILMAGYFVLLSVQLLGLLFTQSRGPTFGWLASLFFFFLLLAVCKRRRAMALIVISVALVLGLLLVILNLPHTPFPAVKETPYLGRLLDIASLTARERILTWEGVAKMATADPLRTMVGYGPETMYVTFYPYLQPELADMFGPGMTADRSHNEVWDVVVTTGLIGLVSYLFLLGNIFYWGLKWLGLIQSSRQGVAFVLLCLVGGVLGALIPWLLEGRWRFAGVGLPLGLLMAMAIYLVARVFWENKGKQKTMDSWRQSLLIALLSALIAHLVEIQFGIAIAATRTYFWIYAALLVLVGCSFPQEVLAQAVASHRRRRRRRRKPKPVAGPPTRGISIPWGNSTLVYSLLTSLILMTTSFGLITTQSHFKAGGFGVAGLMAVVWIFCGAMIIAHISEERKSSPDVKGTSSLVTYCLVTWGSFLVFTIINLVTTRPGADFSNSVVVYFLSLSLMLIAIAALLMRGVALPPILWRGARAWLYPFLGLGVIALILATNFNPAKADVYCRIGSTYETMRQYDGSIAMYRRAVRLAPHEDRYYLLLGLASLARAKRTPGIEQKSAWFVESQRALERAVEINPLDPDHVANLGHLYQSWGKAVANPAERVGKLERALEYYRQAMAMSPASHGRRLQGDVLQTQLSLGTAYAAMRELDKAMAIYKQTSEVFPNDYISHKSLATIYQRLGRIGEALAEAKLALELAPEGEKGALEDLIAQLEAEGPYAR